MSLTATQNLDCPSFEIAAYIDGELGPVLDAELESHFAVCEYCAFELNEQKQFLLSLNASLKNEGEIELPANFTKLIVANAESTVSGLRRPRERFNAMFICAALFLFVLFALGSEAGRMLQGVSVVFDQIIAVGGFFGHVVYSFILGLVIIVRSFGAQISFDALAAVAFAIFIAVSLMYVSRRILRIRRA